MKKFFYWVKKTICKNKDCGCFCPMCEHYEECRHDGEEYVASGETCNR